MTRTAKITFHSAILFAATVFLTWNIFTLYPHISESPFIRLAASLVFWALSMFVIIVNFLKNYPQKEA